MQYDPSASPIYNYNSNMSTKQELEKISNICSEELTRYRYNKDLKISDKFRKGKVAGLAYSLELIYYIFEKEKRLKQEFLERLEAQIKDVQDLNDGDYKKGLEEALEWVEKLSKNS